jgi:uncharacterized protein
MKKIVYLILTIILFFSFSNPVIAEDNIHVFDNSNIFSTVETSNLENILDRVENDKYLGFFVLTRSENDVADEMTGIEYAKQFVYNNDIDVNYYGGQVLIFDFYNYDYSIYNYGYADYYFSESDMSSIYDELSVNVDNGIYQMAYSYSEKIESLVKNFDASNISTTGQIEYKGYITDYADLFSVEEEELLKSGIENIRNKYGFDVAILTVNSTNGENIVTFAEDYFVDNNLGIGPTSNGLVYVINMGDRAFRLVTSGEIGQQSFTDYGINSLNDKIAAELTSGDYYQAMNILLDTTKVYIESADSGSVVDKPFFDLQSILISIGVALVIALISLIVSIKRMNNARIKTLATNYIKPGSFNLTRSRDTYLYRNLSRTKRQKNKSRSGGGSFHSGSGGGSFGGGGGHF